jgi:hypothetical protein
MAIITILDFNQGAVAIMEFDEHHWEETEDFLESEGYDSNNCQWLVTDGLNLRIDVGK